MKRKVRLHPVSAKRAEEQEAYKILREAFLGLNRFCAAKLSGCQYWSHDIHHTKGRGKNYLQPQTWMPICRHCHRYLTDHKQEAVERGLSESNYQPAEG
jgi:hypothetical protein